MVGLLFVRLGCWIVLCCTTPHTTHAKESAPPTHLAVVVQDDDHARAQVPRAVQGLKGHPARDGPVPDDGDAVVDPLAGEFFAD